jgi:hypothetical protein
MAILTTRGLSSCSAQQQQRVADTLTRTIRDMDAGERTRLLALVSAQVAEDEQLLRQTPVSGDDLLLHALDHIARVIGTSHDHADIHMRQGCNRIHLAWDYDARHHGHAIDQVIMVRCGHARSTLAYARRHGTVQQDGEADLMLTAKEWTWLGGDAVARALRQKTGPFP